MKTSGTGEVQGWVVNNPALDLAKEDKIGFKQAWVLEKSFDATAQGV